MRILHLCGAEIIVQGIEWPPKVVICNECMEIMGLSEDCGEEKASFKKIGIYKAK